MSLKLDTKRVPSIQLWYLTMFVMLFSVKTIQGQNNRQSLSHTFQGHRFDFSNWRRSRAGFECPSGEEYVLLCKLRWDTITSELEVCRNPGVQCANGTVVTSTCIIAIEAIAIGALLLYACRMRKKARRNDLNFPVQELRVQTNKPMKNLMQNTSQ